MGKIAFTTLLNRENSVLSPHFGKAKWILIRDENGQVTFEQNTMLNGRAVVDIVLRHGCSDAVFTQIGPGALHHLQQAGIRGWIGPAGTPVPELVERLSRGELAPAQAHESTPVLKEAGRQPAGSEHGTGQHAMSGGCCCGQQGYGHRGDQTGRGCHGR